jgi:hypothetical protein
MLEQTLYSIATAWSQLPDLTVVSDGSIDLCEIERRLRWWPRRLQIVSWEEHRNYHAAAGRPELVSYANRHPFGRKLSSLLAFGERTRSLWIDCDILFFSDFSCLIPVAAAERPTLLAAEDWCYGYDQHLLKAALPHLLDLPPVNTGVALIEGEIYGSCELQPLIALTARYCDSFTEQTILAEAVRRIGRIQWGLHTIRIFDDDKYSLKPTYPHTGWVARHYVTNIRHLFPRDALALRFKWGVTSNQSSPA